MNIRHDRFLSGLDIGARALQGRDPGQDGGAVGEGEHTGTGEAGPAEHCEEAVKKALPLSTRFDEMLIRRIVEQGDGGRFLKQLIGMRENADLLVKQAYREGARWNRIRQERVDDMLALERRISLLQGYQHTHARKPAATLHGQSAVGSEGVAVPLGTPAEDHQVTRGSAGDDETENDED